MRHAICGVAAVILLALSLAPRISAQQQKALLLFGGKDHKTFLGCLNCAETSQLSICNQFGTYGSAFQTDSIWDGFGEFGSEFSEYSPWNDFSTNAPIIVDKDGSSYGYFTTNSFHHDRTRIKWLLDTLNYFEKSQDLDKTRDHFCGDD